MAQGGLKSDPQGVAIRVVSPVDGTYAGIGDTVQVDVIAYAGVSNLDTVIVGLSSSIALADFGDLGFIDTLTAPTSTSKPAVVHQGTSLETFTAKFGIAAGDTETEDATTVVQARVSVEGDDAALKKLDNQSELDMMLGVESFGTVGDGVMIGIDGQRPSGMIDTVYVDTAGVAVFPGETDTRSFKVGSEVRLQLEVTNVPADAEAHIYIVGVGNESDLPDSALVSLAYGFGDLITGELRDSFAVASGDFEDNVRARAVAFVQDGAGNLSASSASSANPEGLQDGLFHVYDGQAPTITAVVPNPDSGRMHFTGMDTSRFDYVEDAGGLTSGKVFDLNPLTFTVGEASVSLRAAGASDTVDFGAKSAGTYSFATMTATDSLGANAVQAGVKMDVTLLAQDSVGNVGNLLLDDVIQDVVSPEPDRVFPRSGDLPGPDARTVNEETRHPLIGLPEAIDSISVRFVQVADADPDVVEESVEGLAASDDDVKITVMDTLIDGEDYRFQVFARDVAGNVFVTAVDTLSFTKAFANPTVDSFLVTIDSTSTSVDSVIAGVGLPLKVTAIDTKNVGELRTVVTFEQAGVLLCIDAGEQDTSGVSFSGEGVTDNGDGTAGLDGEGWMLGSRTVRVASNLTLDDFSVVVEDTSSQEQADPTGRLDSLTVDAAEFSQYQLSVLEEGVETAVVSGDFQITVLPIDAFGNPSTKVFIRAQDISSSDSLTASINLLQTRIPAGNVMDRIWVDFGTNIGDVEIPSGPQEVLAEGSTFTAVAPDREGEGLVIRVRAANEAPDTSGIAESQRTAAGVSKALSFIPFGEEPMVVTPAPPDTLVVHDYAGSDGKGDQGRYVLVTFPKSDDHGRIGQYRIYRELAVASAIGEDGKVVKGAEAVERFISWAVITPPPDTTEALVRAVVPSLDNKETRWAVAGEWGGAPTEPVPLGKPASSGPPLDIPRPPTAAGALGETVLPVPSEGTGSPAMATLEVGSIVQVQGFTDADDTVSLSARSSTGRSSVSKGGPSQTEGPAEAATKPIASTPKTISAPARAIDNLAPAAATEVSASAGDDGTVSLAWTPSADDRPVGLVTYRGFSMPIPGVEAYEVLRGPDAESLGRIATVDAGLKAFVDDAPLQGGMVYRVDALDLDNRSEGAPVGVSAGPTARPDWRDAEGNAVFIIDPNDGSPTEVDFGDFVALAQAFGSSVGDERYIALADTNDDGVINFTDFVAFATSFGRVAVTEDGEGI